MLSGSNRQTGSAIARYRGCLFGIAIGDALGAPVELLSLERIKEEHGPQGLTEPRGPLRYTDDTQMSLATAVGCLRAFTRMRKRGVCHPPSMIYHRYLAWLETQNDPDQRRGPGSTCLAALRSGKMGTIGEPINNSKGCGGVMRTAPIGLAFLPADPYGAFEMGAQSAATTHGHPSGYLPAGFVAEMVALMVAGRSLHEAIGGSIEQLVRYDGHAETLAKVEEARRLAASPAGVEQSIAELGAGWVGDEALAIALYCALKFPGDWRAGVLAAVNHSGDSDSTGSICGAILGTLLGLQGMPAEWVYTVENAARIMKLADDMYLAARHSEDLARDDYPGY